jgi:ABC-type glutathione transport system ATPase component
MMSELLRVTDFSLEVGNSRPVDGISFTLKQGEKVCLIGESGAGKTLTALSLLGLQPGNVVSGDAIFNTPGGTQVSLFKSPQKKIHALRGKHIGYVFQEPGLSLNPSLKVGKQIAETVKAHNGVSENEAREESQKWLEKVGFTNPVDIFRRTKAAHHAHFGHGPRTRTVHCR